MNREFLDNLNYDDTHKVGALCSYLSTLAYSDKSSQYRWLIERMGLEDFTTDESKIVNYFTIKDPKRKVYFVVFRGTCGETFKDRIRNLMVSLQFSIKKVDKKYRVHKGYYHTSEIIFEKLFFDVKEAHDEGYKIIFTGHSLGGAISKYLSIRCEIDCDVYTFGSPRVACDRFFNTDYNVNIHNYVMDGDYIPNFPSNLHNTRPYYELKDEEIHIKNMKKSNILCSLFYLIELKLVFTARSFYRYHAIRGYAYSLRKLTKDSNENS